MFDHKRIHRITWVSPDGDTGNQIDHVLIDRRHVSDIMNVRSYRGANIDSDHYLVDVRLRARISNIKKTKGNRHTKYKTDALKDETVLRSYQEHIRDNLNSDIDGPVSDLWRHCSSVIKQAAEHTLDREGTRRRNNWLNNFDEVSGGHR